MLYVSAGPRICSAYEPRPNFFVDLTATIIIWQAQNCEPTLDYRSSKTQDKINYACVLHD